MNEQGDPETQSPRQTGN